MLWVGEGLGVCLYFVGGGCLMSLLFLRCDCYGVFVRHTYFVGKRSCMG